MFALLGSKNQKKRTNDLIFQIELELAMSPSAEEHLQKAVRLHQASDFKKGIKEAEEARKKFQKEDRKDRAIEALRVMGDCTLNARELKKAQKIYENLFAEGASISNVWFQAAANWGLGQISLHKMSYMSALKYFQQGLEQAQSVADNWYTAWNAFGLGNALRGLARLDEATKAYHLALEAFRAANQSTFVTWVERTLKEIGADVPDTGHGDGIPIWLCPMCGSKLTQAQGAALKAGNMTTCEYCGTAIG
ncbi:tetratricopeptide repeat protein [Candidatus Thorarchaeota archaeon]|nr:MAG: tetratricopeptide repeat protein [Candidatus Thorarchaeota archaeon]